MTEKLFKPSIEKPNLLGDKELSASRPYFCNSCMLHFTKAGIMRHLGRHLIPYRNTHQYYAGAKNGSKTYKNIFKGPYGKT